MTIQMDFGFLSIAAIAIACTFILAGALSALFKCEFVPVVKESALCLVLLGSGLLLWSISRKLQGPALDVYQGVGVLLAWVVIAAGARSLRGRRSPSTHNKSFNSDAGDAGAG